MSEFVSKLNFDTDFHVPKDCLRKGDVDCKVVFADCQVVERWDEMLTFKVKLVLRISIRRGDLRCCFDKEVVLRETIWFDGRLDLLECDVKAAVCKCVLKHGLVWCNGTVSVSFEFRKPKPFCPCPPRHHHKCDHCNRCDKCDPCDRCDRFDDGDEFDDCDCVDCRKPCKRRHFSCKPKRVCRH